METIFTAIAIVVYCIAIFSVTDLFVEIVNMRRLSGVPELEPEDQPLVSLIVPACNEEENI